jgi:hypothetical protein
MLLRGMGMDLEEIRELEEEIRRLWGEIPRERREAIKVARAENFSEDCYQCPRMRVMRSLRG